MNQKDKLAISERSMKYGSQFAAAWRGSDSGLVEYWFNLYKAERRLLPKEYDPDQDRIHRFESELAYMATQGEFEG